MVGGISIEFDTRKLDQKLAGLDSVVKNAQPIFEDIGNDLITYYGNEVFTSGGAALKGGGWRSLANATIEARTKRTGYYKQAPIATGKILIWTGRLMNGFKKEASRVQLRIHNIVSYFKYHQKGGGRLPKREMLAITPRTIKTVNDKFREAINKKIA